MNILALDTSNETLAVAIQKDGKLAAEKMTNIKKDHSSRLMPAVVGLMEDAALEPEHLDKIIVGRGPGSYTGVRIGVTTAKAMAWALDIPIVPVSSLRALAYNGRYFDGYIWTFFNARRNAMFTALFQFENGKLVDVIGEQYAVLDDWFAALKNLPEKAILCISPHIDLFKETIELELKNRTLFASDANRFLRPGNLLMEGAEQQEVPVHFVKPHYLRMTEAEANLLKGKEQ